MNQVCHIYRLIFPNGKMYVGVTVDVPGRVCSHAKNDTPCGYAIRKYGSPKVEVLLIAEREYCMKMEGELTRLWNTVAPNGYNQQHGGHGGSVPSEMSRQRMSEAHKGNRHSTKTKVKMKKAHKNRPLISEETRQRLSQAAKRRGMSRSVIEAGNIGNKTPWTQKRRGAHKLLMKQWWVERKAGVRL